MPHHDVGTLIDSLARAVGGRATRRGALVALATALVGRTGADAAKVPIGGRCTRKSICAGGGICRDKVCGCFGSRELCGNSCFKLVRGDTGDGCTKAPGMSYCSSDHYCKKLPYTGDVSCSCDAMCCSTPDSPTECRQGECCIVTGGACGDMDHACCNGVCESSGLCR